MRILWKKLRKNQVRETRQFHSLQCNFTQNLRNYSGWVQESSTHQRQQGSNDSKRELILAQMLMQRPMRQGTFLNQMPHVSQPPLSQPVYVPSNMHTMQSPKHLNGGYAHQHMVQWWDPHLSSLAIIHQNSPQGQYFNTDNGQHYHSL